jgi:xanthine/CO dehydrogenase XdhC/CoxF family maturation factor
VAVLTGAEAGSHELRTDGTAAVALAEDRAQVVEENGMRVFYEPMQPPLRLVVCGAGHDAVPLVRQAAELGWRVTVADVRRTLLTHDRFPDAAGFSDADPEASARAMRPDARTAVVLMSHNYLRDIAYLGAFLEASPAYLGVLGPRGRTEQMLTELGRSGEISRLHAPAGLDIGAEGPDEVARAIVAEILAATRGRGGGPLRERRGPIHDPR